MKEIAVGSPKKIKYAFFIDIAKTIGFQVTYSIIGFLSARGSVLGEYSPFGIAFAASVPYNYMLTSILGCLTGYIVPNQINMGMRYIASVIAVGAIRWTLNDLKKLTNHQLFPSVLSFIPLIATGLAVASVLNFEASTVSTVALESFLSAAGAYFFSKTFKFITNNRGISSISHEEFACFSMTICIIMLSLSNLYVLDMSVGRIISVLIILICSNYASIAGGSISGIASGIILGISSSSLSYISSSYAFAGMMSGLFSPIGKIATVAAFFISDIIITFETGDTSKLINSVYEVSVSSFLFLAIPKGLSDKLELVFSKQNDNMKTVGLKNTLSQRLDYISKTMSEISNSIISVSEKLLKIDSKNADDMYYNTISKICRHCGLKIFCWEQEKSFTQNGFLDIANKLKKNGHISESDFKEVFCSKCKKSSDMIYSINKCYDEFSIKESSKIQINNMRSIISEQFLSISDILKDLKNEFRDYVKFNDSLSDQIMHKLRQMDITPLEVSCFENKFGRLLIEIEILNYQKRKLDVREIRRKVSDICGYKLDRPLIDYTGDKCRIQMSETPEIDIKVGTSQHICNNGKWCGDSYSYFDDGMGRKIIIISDGMGTGGKAAVDGAMTTSIMSKLIKSGLGFNSSLKIVNSALLAKSDDESLATVDIVSIDMFTGKTEFLKAGASSTFVRKGKQVIKVNTPSLPIGILNNVNFSSSEIALRKGDWVLMISDGAISGDDKWIEKEFREYKDENISNFAKHMVNVAISKKAHGYDDDITAIAIKIA